MRRKLSRVSFGLVALLAVALLCNVYLIMLLWSGRGTNTKSSDETPSRLTHNTLKVNNQAKAINTGLTKQQLAAVINTTRPIRSGRSGAVISLINRLKRELNARKTDVNHMLETSSSWVSPTWLMPSFIPELGDMIQYLTSAEIIKASVPHVGTQLKVMITLAGGQKALLKPQWYNRSTVIEGTVYSGADRHNGEIVAFYLSLLLGLRRTPIAVGRRINLNSDIFANADRELATTFFKNNQSDTCFYGVCRYCKRDSSVCAGHDGLIEAAVILWLPSTIKLKSYRSPWQRTYKKSTQAEWETDEAYCFKLQNQSKVYGIGEGRRRRLLDLVDASVFDFIISNGDRHHYEVVDGSSDPAVLLLDNGKSFGRADVDYLDILAPLYQCCVIRKSLFLRLGMLAEGGPGGLGAVLKELTVNDALHPLLTDDHTEAISRRLGIVLQTIEACAKVRSWESVLIL